MNGWISEKIRSMIGVPDSEYRYLLKRGLWGLLAPYCPGRHSFEDTKNDWCFGRPGAILATEQRMRARIHDDIDT